MSEIVLNGLVKRRAELAGDIENTQKLLGDLVESLQHLDGQATEPGFACRRQPNDRCMAQYQARISGPLLDRIDLIIECRRSRRRT